MIDREILSASVSANDQQTDTTAESETSPLPALFTELGIDPDAAFHVAEQRALRLLAFTTGRDPKTMTRGDLEENKQFMTHAAAMFLDGLGAGRRLSREQDAQIRELIEAAYKNSGLDYDSIRRIGPLVGADEGLIEE